MTHIYLFVILQAVSAAVLGGIGIVAVLVLGHVSARAILIAIGVGFALSFPIALVLRNRLTRE